MKLYKLICHINCIIQKFFFKIIYRNNIKIGRNTTWRKRFNITADKNASIIIGDNCFFNNDCSINAIGKIEIGEGCLIGENVKMYDHNHRFCKINIPIKNQGFSVGQVIIGKHCWIGSNVIILKGTNIGDNCVIGAGCIINNNIPCNTIIKPKYDYEKQNLILQERGNL